MARAMQYMSVFTFFENWIGSESGRETPMQKITAEFTYKVPATHPDAGTQFKSTFEHDKCENETEALATIKTKEWSILDLVNEVLKRNARSNATQNALLPYKTTTVPPEEIKERMIRDFIRMGKSESVARKIVEASLAADV